MTTDGLVLHAPREQNAPDAEGYALEVALRSLISLGSGMLPRSQQRAIGASQIGAQCSRKLAYKLAHTTPVNVRDPLRALVGVGVHSVMATIFDILDAGSGRFLVEQSVKYRGVPGTCDLFDRLTGTVVDWKTTFKSKLARVRIDGPPSDYATQVQVYGAALAAIGENVRTVAIAYIPIDSVLDDMWVWRAAYDQQWADAAIGRVDALRRHELTGITGPIDPSTVEATPSALCKWCDHYQPSATDLSIACPGK